MANEELRMKRITELAEHLCDREAQIAFADGVLEVQDLVNTFALAATMSVLRLSRLDTEFAEELGGSAVRCIINNLMVNGIEPRITE